MDQINVTASQKGSRGKRPQIVEVPSAHIPFGIVFDRRISNAAFGVVGFLCFFADNSDRCTMTDADLARGLRVSISTIKRSLLELENNGYIRREATEQTSENWSGRIVHLLWVSDPSIVPPPPPLG